MTPQIDRAKYALVVSDSEDPTVERARPAGWAQIVDGTAAFPEPPYCADMRWPDRLSAGTGASPLGELPMSERQTQPLDEVVDAQHGSWTG